MALYAVTQKMGERDPQEEMVYAFRLFDDDDTGRMSLNVRPNTPPASMQDQNSVRDTMRDSDSMRDTMRDSDSMRDSMRDSMPR